MSTDKPTAQQSAKALALSLEKFTKARSESDRSLELARIDLTRRDLHASNDLALDEVHTALDAYVVQPEMLTRTKDYRAHYVHGGVFEASRFVVTSKGRGYSSITSVRRTSAIAVAIMAALTMVSGFFVIPIIFTLFFLGFGLADSEIHQTCADWLNDRRGCVEVKVEMVAELTNMWYRQAADIDPSTPGFAEWLLDVDEVTNHGTSSVSADIRSDLTRRLKEIITPMHSDTEAGQHLYRLRHGLDAE